MPARRSGSEHMVSESNMLAAAAAVHAETAVFVSNVEIDLVAITTQPVGLGACRLELGR